MSTAPELNEKALEAAYQDYRTVTGEHVDEHLEEAIQDAIHAYLEAISATEGVPQGEAPGGEDAHVLAVIERELGIWECYGPDELRTTVSGLIAAERASFRAAAPEKEPAAPESQGGSQP